MTTNLPAHLARLGDALEEAATADLAARGVVTSERTSREAPPAGAIASLARRLPGRVWIGAIVATIAIPAAALAAGGVFSSSEVASSLPAGALLLAGTEPSCSQVSAVEFHCILATPPAVGPESGSRPEAGEASAGHGRETICSTHDARGRLLYYKCPSSQSRTSQGPTSAPEAGSWRGTVEPTVGPDHRVNGGCRSLDAEGRSWECYLGEAAVAQKIIGAGLLGELTTGPSLG